RGVTSMRPSLGGVVAISVRGAVIEFRRRISNPKNRQTASCQAEPAPAALGSPGRDIPAGEEPAGSGKGCGLYEMEVVGVQLRLDETVQAEMVVSVACRRCVGMTM